MSGRRVLRSGRLVREQGQITTKTETRRYQEEHSVVKSSSTFKGSAKRSSTVTSAGTKSTVTKPESKNIGNDKNNTSTVVRMKKTPNGEDSKNKGRSKVTADSSPGEPEKKQKTGENVDMGALVASRENLNKFIAEEMCLDETFLIDKTEKTKEEQFSEETMSQSQEIIEKTSRELSHLNDQTSNFSSKIEENLQHAEKVQVYKHDGEIHSLNDTASKGGVSESDSVRVDDNGNIMANDAAIKKVSSMIKEQMKGNERNSTLTKYEAHVSSESHMTSTKSEQFSNEFSETKGKKLTSFCTESKMDSKRDESEITSYGNNSTFMNISESCTVPTEYERNNNETETCSEFVSTLDIKVDSKNSASEQTQQGWQRMEDQHQGRQPVHVNETQVVVEEKGGGRGVQFREVRSTAAEAGSTSSMTTDCMNQRPRCICQICECGRHRCPHSVTSQRSSHVRECLVSDLEHSEVDVQRYTTTSREMFSPHPVSGAERQQMFRHEDHLYMEGDGHWETESSRRNACITQQSHFTDSMGLDDSLSRMTDWSQRASLNLTPDVSHDSSLVYSDVDTFDGTTRATRGGSSHLHSASTTDVHSRSDGFEDDETRRLNKKFGNRRFSEDYFLCDTPIEIAEKNIDVDNFHGGKLVEMPPCNYSSSPIKYHDNLRPEGEFAKRPEEPTLNVERSSVVRHEDNLRMEGEFVDTRQYEAVTKGERYETVKRTDNLKLEGEFEKRPIKSVPIAERASVVKHGDHLVLEGEFEKRPKGVIPLHEKSTPIRHSDNLRPEGEFVGRLPYEAPRGERSPIVRRYDNLVTEGEFIDERDRHSPVTGERADVIKHVDNLRLEGSFEKRKISPSPKAERSPVVKHQDQLVLEGRFEGRPEQHAPSAEKRQPIRQSDNLRPEGDFIGRPDQKAPTGERAPIVKHGDHLITQGDFVDSREKIAPIRGERAPTVKHPDNLKMDGEFDKRPKAGAPKGERAPIVKHNDHLTVDGVFEGRPAQRAPYAEKQAPIKYHDNLRPEGEFAQRPEEPTLYAERSSVVRHEDNLRMEGEFVDTRQHSSVAKSENSNISKCAGHSKIFGVGSINEFSNESSVDVAKCSTGSNGIDKAMPLNNQRVSPIRHKDNLRLEGDIEGLGVLEKVVKCERTPARRPADNLRVQGYHSNKKDVMSKSVKDSIRQHTGTKSKKTDTPIVPSKHVADYDNRKGSVCGISQVKETPKSAQDDQFTSLSSKRIKQKNLNMSNVGEKCTTRRNQESLDEMNQTYVISKQAVRSEYKAKKLDECSRQVSPSLPPAGKPSSKILPSEEKFLSPSKSRRLSSHGISATDWRKTDSPEPSKRRDIGHSAGAVKDLQSQDGGGGLGDQKHPLSESPARTNRVRERHASAGSSAQSVKLRERTPSFSKLSANEDHIKGILFQDALRSDSSYTDMRRRRVAVVRGERCEAVRHHDNLTVGAGTSMQSENDSPKGVASSRTIGAGNGSPFSCSKISSNSRERVQKLGEHSVEYQRTDTSADSANVSANSTSLASDSRQVVSSAEQHGLQQRTASFALSQSGSKTQTVSTAKSKTDSTAKSKTTSSVESKMASSVESKAVSSVESKTASFVESKAASSVVRKAASSVESKEFTTSEARGVSATGAGSSAPAGAALTGCNRQFVESLRRDDEVRKWSANSHHDHRQQLKSQRASPVSSSPRQEHTASCTARRQQEEHEERCRVTRAARSMRSSAQGSLVIHGDYDVFSGTRKNRNYAVFKPCPASAIDSPLSNMRVVRTTQKHTFYMPKVSD